MSTQSDANHPRGNKTSSKFVLVVPSPKVASGTGEKLPGSFLTTPLKLSTAAPGDDLITFLDSIKEVVLN
jgi:hypothetical protein